MRFTKYIPHILVLVIISLAEMTRIQVFYEMLVDNLVSSIAISIVSTAIIFYLAYYKYSALSIVATAICIAINLASFVPTLMNTQDKIETKRFEMLAYPEYDQHKYWAGRDAYKRTFELEVERVKAENERRSLENEKLENTTKPLNFWYMAVTVVLMSIFIPILNYFVSHKIASLGDNVKQPKNDNGNGFTRVDIPELGDDDRNGKDTDWLETIAMNDEIQSHLNAEDEMTQEERDSKVRELYQSGYSAIYIANKFNMSRQYVYKILDKFRKQEQKLNFA